MNLKQEITKTENLETKLKKGITNINDVIVRGGGVQSTSVAEVPENITKMLGQYKKIAIGNANKKFTQVTSEQTINLNLTFKPSRVFFKFTVRDEVTWNENSGWIEYGQSDLFNYFDSTSYYARTKFTWRELNQTYFKVRVAVTLYGDMISGNSSCKITDWIAIE